MSLLSQFRWRADRPFIARSALRGIAHSINFSLIALSTNHLRNLRFGTAIPDADEHYGQTIDSRNEIDGQVEGADVEIAVREAQGYAVLMPPLELASRLKVIRDSCAFELHAHAGKRMNPLTNKLFLNTFDVVQPVSESLNWQLAQKARIDDAVVRNTAAVLGLDEESIRVSLEKQHDSQQKFVRENAAELYTIIDNLVYKGEDGHAFGIDDDETVEERLPPINRMRLYVAADKGLIGQRLLEVRSYVRNADPVRLGNIGLIDGERELLRSKFNKLMDVQHIKDEINDASQRGARVPTLSPLFPKVKMPQEPMKQAA